MIQAPEDRRPTITPQLAWRVALMGGFALALFAIVFFRLWFLQVLSGQEYLAQANDNRVRDIRKQAPRGNIVDRNGTVLVRSRASSAVKLQAERVPQVEQDLVEDYRARLAAAERRRLAAPRGSRRRRSVRVPIPPLPAGAEEQRRLYARLGRVIGMRPSRIHRRVVEQVTLTPYADVTLKTDVPRAVINYLQEHQDDFPGIEPTRVFLRAYPHRQLAAQLFGTVGEVSRRELRERHFRGVQQGTIVGKGGLEYTYDRYLRGRDGATRVQVDSFGRPKGTVSEAEPAQGRQLRLSLDLGLQAEGQRAMGRAIGLANGNGNPARAGGFVAMDPRNGEVLAMGSYPSFDPNVFAKPISQSRFQAIQNAPGAPLFDRAIAGEYPTGSTFKVITAAAALDSGLITPETPLNDPGKIKIGNIVFQNAGGVANGTLPLRKAIQVSSDVFFYQLGARANGLPGQVVQTWARRLGLGRPTGIDLPGEFDGLVPDARWRNRAYARYLRCKERGKEFCGFVDRPWSVGDNVNLAVGQGDLQATPLQMAVAYAAIANGGKVVRPHLGMEVLEPVDGAPVQRIEPSPARRVKIPQRQAILDGLRLAAGAPGGTSADVFKGFPRPVFGKTGTAERPGQADQSWYVAFVPDRARPIVLAVTVEKGGFGAEAAAPAARLMLSEWFDVRKRLVVGSSRTR